MEIENLVTPVVVSAVVTAIVGPFIFFFLKRWDEDKKRNFEIRYAEYKHYLKSLEQIAVSGRSDFERFMNEGYAECMRKILKGEGDSNDILIDLNNRVNELTRSVREAFTKATQELHGLRLVCSIALLEMVNEFIEIQRRLMDQSGAVLAKLNQIDLANPNAMLSGEMEARGRRAQELFELIVKQMRKELGIK